MKRPFTQLENETMEALARASFSAREFRVMLAVIRLTNGFHLTETSISLKDLIDLTGLARNHLQATIKRLSQWQVVIYKDGVVACHGPALWLLPHSPKSGLQSQVGTTVPDSPKSGLSQIVPGPDTKTPALKKVQRKYKESTPPIPPQRGAPPDPRVPEVAQLLEKERGYRSPNHAAEAGALKWMLTQGHSPEDILACWRAIKRDPWWACRELLMTSVRKEIGHWVGAARRPDAFERKRHGGQTRGPWDVAKEYTEPAPG